MHTVAREFLLRSPVGPYAVSMRCHVPLPKWSKRRGPLVEVFACQDVGLILRAIDSQTDISLCKPRSIVTPVWTVFLGRTRPFLQDPHTMHLRRLPTPFFPFFPAQKHKKGRIALFDCRAGSVKGIGSDRRT